MTSLALAAAATLALTACSGGSNDNGGGEGSSPQTNAMYAWISNENDRAQWQAFIDAAKEEDPSFDLTL